MVLARHPGWFYTFARQKNAVDHFIIYKAGEKEIITLGLWQIHARKVDYHSAQQSQPVNRSAPVRQVTAFLIWEHQKMPPGRRQPDVSRTASELPESLSGSRGVLQPTEKPPGPPQSHMTNTPLGPVHL